MSFNEPTPDWLGIIIIQQPSANVAHQYNQSQRPMYSPRPQNWSRANLLTVTVPLDSLHDSSIISSGSQAEFGTDQQEEDQNFNVLPSSRPQEDEISERTIRRSMVNRSCIRTSNFSCRNLTNIPTEIRGVKAEGLRNLQKIDLSFNLLSGIEELAFQKLASLKELLLNDNEISDLPYVRMNQCKGLRLINLTNNNITLIPPLDKVAYLQVRGNPVRLVTSQLMRLPLEFLTFDWMEYLGDLGSEGDNFRAFTKEYGQFKKDILGKIDFSKQQNRSYCDFHCFFTARLQGYSSKDDRSRKALFSGLIARSVLRNDGFFIAYLRNFHNQINYASSVYNCRLLLQLVLETNHTDAQELFKLRRLNYSELSTPEVYFESVRLCCQYSNYEFFKYLLSIKQRRKAIQTDSYLSVLIDEILHRYNRQKQSDRILIQLVRLYKEVQENRVVVKLPSQYNHRLFKSLSQGALDIYNSQFLRECFSFVGESGSTTPLHFAMRSRNEQFVRILLKEGQDVLARCDTGSSCKFSPGSTQMSRKMVWKRQKQMIQQQWSRSPVSVYENPVITTDGLKISRGKNKNVNAMIKAMVPYEDLHSSCLTYRKPEELSSSRLELTSSCIWKKECYKEELLAQLSAKISAVSELAWNSCYRKKRANTDVALFVLHKIAELSQEEEDETQIFRKLQAWSQLTESLGQFFEAAAGDELVGFQIIQTMEGLSIGGRREAMVVKTERASSYIVGGSFWCCQNTTCD